MTLSNDVRDALYAFWMSHTDNAPGSEDVSKRLVESFPILIQVVEKCSSLADNIGVFIKNKLEKDEKPYILFGKSSAYMNVDTMVFGRVYGHDAVEFSAAILPTDIIKLTGLTPDDVSLRESGGQYT